MKRKKRKFYILFLALMFTFIIGAVSSSMVYADPTPSQDGNEATTSSVNSKDTGNVKTGLDTQGLQGDSLKDFEDYTLSQDKSAFENNAKAGYIFKFINNLKNDLSILAWCICAVFISVTGIELMNNASDDVVGFIKKKEKLVNSVQGLIFLGLIPLFINALNVDIPLNNLQNNTAQTAKIMDVMILPESTYIDDWIKQQKESVSNGTNNLKEQSKTFSEDDNAINISSSGANSFIKAILNFIIGGLATLVYIIMRLIDIVFGALAFVPINFNPKFYSADKITDLFKLSGTIEIGGDVVASGLQLFTMAINDVYYVLKIICSFAIDIVCYYYGIMLSIGRTDEKIKDFLVTMAKGLVGMAFAPVFIQILIDMDMVFSTAILSVIGGGVPGMAFLNILPDISLTGVFKNDCVKVIFYLILAIAIFTVCITFFKRRMELTLYYIASPAIFLFSMIPGSKFKGIIKNWAEKIENSSFLTTKYAPIFLIATTVILSIKSEASILTLFVCYALGIGFLVFVSKNINLISSLFGMDINSAGTSGKGGLGSTLAGVATFEGIKNSLGGKALGGALGGAGAAVNAAAGGYFSKLGKKVSFDTKYRREHGGNNVTDQAEAVKKKLNKDELKAKYASNKNIGSKYINNAEDEKRDLNTKFNDMLKSGNYNDNEALHDLVNKANEGNATIDDINSISDKELRNEMMDKLGFTQGKDGSDDEKFAFLTKGMNDSENVQAIPNYVRSQLGRESEKIDNRISELEKIDDKDEILKNAMKELKGDKTKISTISDTALRKKVENQFINNNIAKNLRSLKKQDGIYDFSKIAQLSSKNGDRKAVKDELDEIVDSASYSKMQEDLNKMRTSDRKITEEYSEKRQDVDDKVDEYKEKYDVKSLWNMKKPGEKANEFSKKASKFLSYYGSTGNAINSSKGVANIGKSIIKDTYQKARIAKGKEDIGKVFNESNEI